MECSSEGSDIEDNGGGACGGIVEEEVQRVLLRLENGFGRHRFSLLVGVHGGVAARVARHSCTSM